MNKKKLTIELLQKEAKSFAKKESLYYSSELYDITDGKAVGTYLEHKFQAFLHKKYKYNEGSSAKGLDFPELHIDMKVTGDFQTTTGLRKIIENRGNIDDIIAFFHERMLPLDEIQAESLATEVLNNIPKVGYLTISNALQWRLQYRRVIQEADIIMGIHKVL